MKSKINKLRKLFSEEVIDFISLSLTSALNHGIRLFTGVLNAIYLTPYLYGINAFISTLQRYLPILHFGSQNGLNRQIPIDNGLGKVQRLSINLMSVFWFLAFISFFIIAASVLLFVLNIELNLLPKNYYIITALGCITTLYYAYFNSYLISTQKFKLLSKQRVVIDTSLAIISVLLVYYFKMFGLLWGIIFAQVLFCVSTIYYSDFKVSIQFSLKHLIGLINVGLPIMISSFAYLLYNTLDIIFMAGKVDSFQFGLYGFALTGVAAFKVYATSISDMVSPKLGRLYGESNYDKRKLFDFIKKYNQPLILFLSILVVFFYYAIPMIIESYLLDYKMAIIPFKLLILTAFALNIYIPYGISLTTLKKNNIYTVVLIVYSAITYSILKIFCNQDFINFAPKVMLVSGLLYSFTIIVISTYLINDRLDMRSILQTVALTLALVSFVLMIDYLPKAMFPSGTNHLVKDIVKLILTEGAIILYFIFGYKKEIKVLFKK